MNVRPYLEMELKTEEKKEESLVGRDGKRKKERKRKRKQPLLDRLS